MWPRSAEKAIDVTVEGTLHKVWFRWDMTTFGMFEDLRSASLSQLAREFMDPKFNTLVDFFYAGYLRYCQKHPEEDAKGKKEIKIDYDREFFNDFIGALGIKEAKLMIDSVFEKPAEPDDEKNATAPQTTGLA